MLKILLAYFRLIVKTEAVKENYYLPTMIHLLKQPLQIQTSRKLRKKKRNVFERKHQRKCAPKEDPGCWFSII